jgi:hypothetical protein
VQACAVRYGCLMAVLSKAELRAMVEDATVDCHDEDEAGAEWIAAYRYWLS